MELGSFVEVFKAEFIPQSKVEKREDKFKNLKHGSMIVAQYTAQFN
jgi:hypothetical protein